MEMIRVAIPKATRDRLEQRRLSGETVYAVINRLLNLTEPVTVINDSTASDIRKAAKL